MPMIRPATTRLFRIAFRSMPRRSTLFLSLRKTKRVHTEEMYH